MLAHEGAPVELDKTHLTDEILFQRAKQNQGDMGVIAIAEDFECDVKQRYDRVTETTSDFEVDGLLRRQRTEVEFGEHVLHCMARPIRPR